MSKNKFLKIFTIISVLGLLSVAIIASPASALLSQNSMSWHWTSDTSISAVAMGDVDGDGQTEIVTAGHYLDGIHYNAQLIVWNPTTMVGENVRNWLWIADTQISSIALANITGGTGLDIITGGAFWDGTHWNAQLIEWNGATLVGERVVNWLMSGDTQISSVAVANVTGGTSLDVVTGGSFFDGTHWNAQLIEWNGATLVGERVVNWLMSGDTQISSVAVANVTGGTSLDVVTGGSFFDGTHWNAQLIEWNGATLVGERVVNWLMSGDTQISSVAVANVTGGTSLDVVTGGSFFDGTHWNAQLIEWNGATLVGERVVNWLMSGDTTISSIAIGNFTGGTNLNIITGGSFNDGVRNNAQLIVWNGATLTGLSMMTWFTTSGTGINSIADQNVILGAIAGNRVVAGGEYYDNTFVNAQLTLWA